MKITISIGVLLIIMIQSSTAQKLNTEEYRFLMDIPDGFKFTTSEEGKFGIMEGYEAESKTYLYALAYRGEASKSEIYDYGVQMTEIPKSNWTTKEKGQNENGFAWWEVYNATDGSSNVYAIISKNAKAEVYYMFLVLAPKSSFNKYKGDYLKWIESCRGV